MKRLVFLDVDGTLLDHDQELPESAREALTGALEAGHELIMCTGRARPEIYPFLWDIGFSGLVGCNGAYGELDGEVVFNEHMPAENVTEIASWLDSKGADCMWQTGLELYAVRKFLDIFRSSGDSDRSLAGDWTTFLNQVQPYLREGVPETASKVTFFLSRESGVRLDDVVDAFGDRFCIVPGSLPQERGEMGELTALGMNKFVGLEKIAACRGVPVEATVALGDSANDLEMLRFAGTGVAMGNGTAGAKDAADWITAPIDEDGLALAFEKLGLIG
ncbi:HAD family hydrolase [Actinomycetaceae bacterium L2_0104]